MPQSLSTPAPSYLVPRATIGEGSRHFETEGGAPLFWLGDTAWTLFTQYTRDDIAKYFENRSRLGFTVIQAVVCWDGGPGARCEANVDGVAPFIGGDPRTPNDLYFQNVDYVLSAAAERGLSIAVLPLWGASYITGSQLFTVANARQYGRFLGDRYKDQSNIIWMIGGDTAVFDKADVFRELATGIREGDRGAKLLGYHPGTYYYEGRGASTIDPNFNPFGAVPGVLDFNAAQSWAWYDQIPSLVKTMYVSLPARPAVVAEGAYESGPEYPTGPITPLSIRRQAWWSVMSGASYTYGHNQIWRHGPDWAAALDATGAYELSFMKSILTDRRWWQFVPDNSLIADGQGAGFAANVAVRHPPGAALVYMSAPSRVALDLSRIAPAGGKLTARWINPATREEFDAGDFVADGIAWFETPGGWSDSVLSVTTTTRTGMPKAGGRK